MATRESSSKIKYFSSKASGRLLRERTVVRRLMGLEMEFIINYMKIKRCLLIGRKAMKDLDRVLKSRDIDKGLSSQSYGFSSSHVRM